MKPGNGLAAAALALAALGPAGTDGTVRFGHGDRNGPEVILVTSAVTACLISR